MKKFSEYEFTQFIPLSLIIIAASAAVTLLTGYPGPSLAVNGFHLFTLLASIICCNLILSGKSTGWRAAVERVFFFVNVFYVFIAGLVYIIFRSDVSSSLALYFLENICILFTDSVEVLRSIPAGLYIVLFVTIAAGHIVLYGYSERIKLKIYSFRKFPVIYLSIFTVIFIAINIFGLVPEQSGETVTFRGVDFLREARTKHSSTRGFMERYGYSINTGTDIVFIILEGVSAEYFNTSASKFLNSPGKTIRAENFFVPTPHTTLSIYSLLTGNYGDYRSRQKVSAADAADSLPALLRSKGYKTYFLYSGPTYFEGLHEMLVGLGLTIVNKEKLEVLRDPQTGRPYKSFNWGIDDISLVHASADILSRAAESSLFFIGLSSTHSPYFNPEPDKFCRFDNNTMEGRYRNSIDYEVMVIDRLIETFMRRNSDTLFIILSDHGESFGQEGYSRHSFSLYNTEISVPFIMMHRSFGNEMAPFSGSIIDIYPSVADIMGLDLSSSADGRSFFARDYSLRLFLSSWRDGESKGLVLGDRKWIYSRKSGTLYEMNVDDSSRIDLSADPGKRSFVKFLNRQY